MCVCVCVRVCCAPNKQQTKKVYGVYTQIQLKWILCLLGRASLWQLKNKRPTWCHLLFYFTSYVLNMFLTLIYPSSGACDYSVELPHWSYCSWFDVCWSFGVVGLEWYPCCRLKQLCFSLQHLLFRFLCAQHVSYINTSIIRSLRLFCWITTLVILFLVRCVFEFRCEAQLQPATQIQLQPNHTETPTHIELRTIRPMW